MKKYICVEKRNKEDEKKWENQPKQVVLHSKYALFCILWLMGNRSQFAMNKYTKKIFLCDIFLRIFIKFLQKFTP